MIEVIGISPNSFSEAVKNAVNDVAKTKNNIHFFEVTEQRGCVHEGKIKEFQVKVKVAFIE
jgi:flavin-binding protein dodecin